MLKSIFFRPLSSLWALLLILGPVAMVQAADSLPSGMILNHDGGMIHGSGAGIAKAPGDSLLLMGPAGSGAAYIGNFQDMAGRPDWNGWTHHDYTASTDNQWHVSDYMAAPLGGHGPGNLAAWCGEDLPACALPDTAGGYGNNYNETLGWTGVVADPDQPCTVSVEARLNYDVEPGYDFVYLVAFTSGNVRHDLLTFSGQALNDSLNAVFTYQPGDYVGENGDEIHLAFIVESDGGWSDADCQWPTRGACQLDDVTVRATNGVVETVDDFQGGLGSWTAEPRLGVGDFSQIWTGLEDMDPCQTNYSPQVAFIDDGQVVPGVGPTECINWCYGPFGYIVNNTGGRLGPAYHLFNGIESPVMAWPGSRYSGAQLDFTIYMHEELAYDSAGMFPTWDVRSTNSSDPADIELEPWLGRSFVYYGGPDYRRFTNDVSDLIRPDARYVQIQLTVQELGWYWGWEGPDGTPAPYYDNVRLTAFEHDGPLMSVREIDLAQDAFPASGILDETNLGTNNVRFDMARNIAPSTAMMNRPGDSLVVFIQAAHSGAALSGLPRLHYKLLTNPMFDPWRTSGLPLQGYVEGDTARVGGSPAIGSYAFDLPDSGFLFPGDVIHYFFSADEDLSGDIRTAILPADTTGFSDFEHPGLYDPRFTMSALPSVKSYSGGGFSYADLLLWYDGPYHQGLDEWLTSLRELNLMDGYKTDIYRTQGASSGVGNGLGGRATVDQIARYAVILYDSGDLTSYTLGVGDFDNDPSPDVQLLESWLQLPGKGLYLAGNSLASDVWSRGDAGPAFVQDRMGVAVVSSFIRDLIHNQASPMVQVLADDTGFPARAWQVVGGCPRMPAMDAVNAGPSALKVAEYLGPAGDPGYYTYSAATWKTDEASGSTVMSTPFAFDRVWNPGKELAPHAARTLWLKDVINSLGFAWFYYPVGVDVPGSVSLTATAAPNPFNPRVEILFQAPHEGELAVRIYDLQGRSVRTMTLDHIQAGPGKVLWDGRDGAGAPASSGVYFYEVRQGGQVARGKMALIR